MSQIVWNKSFCIEASEEIFKFKMSEQNLGKERDCQNCEKVKAEKDKLGEKLQKIEQQLKTYEQNTNENSEDGNNKLQNLLSELRHILKSEPENVVEFPSAVDFLGQTPEQKAFSNSLILRTVLKYFPAKCLLHCRLVNKLWWEEGTAQLLSSPAHARIIRVVFFWSVEKCEFEHLTMGNLSDFNKFLNSRENYFPCHFFCFEGGDLGSADAQLFFTKYGSKLVASLSLNLVGVGVGQGGVGGDKVTKIHTLRALFLDQLLRLSYVCFENTPWGDENPYLNRLFLPPLNPRALPHLEHLHIAPTAKIPRNFVLDLLIAAVNLKNTYDPTLRFVYQLISTGKVHTVKSILWSYNTAELERLMLFADTQPKLTSLGLSFQMIRNQPNQWPAAANFLSKILASSAATLESWNRMPAIGFLTGVQIPPMTKLSWIHCIENIKTENGQLLPPTLNLESPQLFPNVTIVTFRDFKGQISIPPQAQIAGTQPAAGWLKMIACAIPQLQRLDFTLTLNDLPFFLKTVWKFCPRLKILFCDIPYETKILDRNSCSIMDSAITGIPAEICRNLRKLIHQNTISSCATTSDEGRFLRQSASILNLKELETVRFFFRDFGFMDKKVPMFSRVSFVYGFDLMAKREPFVPFRLTFDHGFLQSDIVEELTKG